MLALTRRRYPERQDCWHVYYGDVHVGTIARSVGNPNAAPQWQWRCGFYPGSRPGECRAVEAQIVALRDKGYGILKIGKKLGVGTSVVQRVFKEVPWR